MPDQITEKLDADKPPNKAAFAGCARFEWLHGEMIIAAEYTELESGKNPDRPQLEYALAQARILKAKILFAYAYPLYNQIKFLEKLQTHKVEFAACDFPKFNRESLPHIILGAQILSKARSDETRAGIEAAVARGGKLGGTAHGAAVAQEFNIAKAHLHRAYVRPFIHKIQRSGITTLNGIAEALMDQGIKTRRGKPVWRAIQVSRILGR